MVVGTVAVLAIIGALLSIFLREYRPTSQMDLMPYRALGEGVGQETLRLIGGAGKVVVLMWGNEQNRPPTVKAMLKSFEQALKKNPAVTLTVEPYPATQPVPEPSPPIELILDLKQKHSQADVLVSFVGLPSMDNDYAQLPAKPKLVAVTTERVESRALFDKGFVDMLIVWREDLAPATAPKPKTNREWFDQHYQVLTAPNR